MKILICDDDLMFAQAVHDRLLEFCSRNGISASVIVHSSAENIPRELLPKFDIAFLDIDMKPTDGFMLAKNIHTVQPNTIIIFLTNYPQFAAEGYEVQAFRFLVKTRLDQKLIPYFQAAVEQFRSIRKTVSFTLSGEETDIPVSDILYIESTQRTVFLHSVGEQKCSRAFPASHHHLPFFIDGCLYCGFNFTGPFRSTGAGT